MTGGPLLVGIGASTGGPTAVADVLGRLPPAFPACIAVVQHLPIGFVEPFAQFLRDSTRLTIEVVRDRATLRPGVVLLAPDDQHLLAGSLHELRVDGAPPLGGHRPSATVLFRSLAQVFGPRGIGIVLSGIGDDGAAGLLEMRRRGALTITQSEGSCAVYGMPKAATLLGGAARVLDLPDIASALLQATT